VDAAAFSNRVHSGLLAQKYFSDGRMHEAGLMQRVTGLRPGTALRFSIFMQAWQCFDANACGANGIRSDQPGNMHLRVGLDPTGGTNPFSPNVVWSGEQAAFDRWVEFAVQAAAKADAVTVFTHSRAEWDFARQNNEVYLDDASLVVASGPGAAAPPSAGQPAATVPTSPPAAPLAPRPTRPGGDTLCSMALRSSTTCGLTISTVENYPGFYLGVGQNHRRPVQEGARCSHPGPIATWPPQTRDVNSADRCRDDHPTHGHTGDKRPMRECF
jgi:hypothetical protein